MHLPTLCEVLRAEQYQCNLVLFCSNVHNFLISPHLVHVCSKPSIYTFNVQAACIYMSFSQWYLLCRLLVQCIILYIMNASFDIYFHLVSLLLVSYSKFRLYEDYFNSTFQFLFFNDYLQCFM